MSVIPEILHSSVSSAQALQPPALRDSSNTASSYTNPGPTNHGYHGAQGAPIQSLSPPDNHNSQQVQYGYAAHNTHGAPRLKHEKSHETNNQSLKMLSSKNRKLLHSTAKSISKHADLMCKIRLHDLGLLAEDQIGGLARSLGVGEEELMRGDYESKAWMKRVIK